MSISIAISGWGEDSIYFDHSGECRDPETHRHCPGRWRGVVSLKPGPDGQRRRKKVSGRNKNEHLQRQVDARLRAGVLWQDNGLVFTTAHGTQLDAADVRRSLRTICMRAGLDEQWTPRELRHTFVSLLSDNGMAIEEISRLMGHSSSNVTETVYRHQIRPVITIGAEAMDKIFANEH
jgi:integrase